MSAVREVLRCRPTRLTRFLGVTSQMPPSMKASMALDLERQPARTALARRQGRRAWPPARCSDTDAQLDLCDAKALHHGPD